MRRSQSLKDSAAICFLFLLFSISVQAKIGETREEIISRYGEVIKEEEKEEGFERLLTFSSGDYDITVAIITGKIDETEFTGRAEGIAFKRKDGAKIGEQEKDELMEEYGQKVEWIKESKPDGEVMFWLKKEPQNNKNQSLICLQPKSQPDSIVIFTTNIYFVKMSAGFRGMTLPSIGK